MPKPRCCPRVRTLFVRPRKWEDSQVGFRGSNASGRRIVLLPGVFWAHGASKMAILGASFLLCILQCFRVWEGMWQFPQEAARYFEFFSLQLLHSTLLNRSHFRLVCAIQAGPEVHSAHGFLTNKIARKCPKSEIWASACVRHIKKARLTVTSLICPVARTGRTLELAE